MRTLVDLAHDSEPDPELLASEAHALTVAVDTVNRDVYVKANTRLALYEFGRSIMLEALHGTSEAEFYPLASEGKWLVVNGARFNEHSSRVFVSYPPTKAATNR